MNCPVDGTTLAMSERHGIEIDYCPTCRGVWLDRGELDKILEGGATNGSRPADDHDDDDDEPIHSGEHQRDHDKPRRGRRGFLGELFEFGD